MARFFAGTNLIYKKIVIKDKRFLINIKWKEVKLFEEIWYNDNIENIERRAF